MKKIILSIIFILGFSVFSNVIAQQVDPAPAVLSPELQRALEVDSVAEDLQKIVVLCANACEPKQTQGSKVRKPMQDIKNIPATRERGSGMASGKRQHKPVTVTKPLDKSSPLLAGSATTTTGHDTGMAIIRKIGARMVCTGAAACVDMIARNNSCKTGTVKCTGASCRCDAR